MARSIIDALTGLGFTRKQAEQAINEIAANRDAKALQDLSVNSPSELLKLALAHANTQKGLGK